MRRTLTAACCALLLVCGGAALYAASGTTLTVKPSEMRDGETKTVTDDGRTITVRREGNTTHLRIEGADKTEELTITREGNRIRVGRVGSDGTRGFVIAPNRERLVIEGFGLEDLEKAPRSRGTDRDRGLQTFFVCPKDRTTLRVPQDKTDQTYRCPVDGTVMEKRKGRGFTFFFDDNSIEL